MCVKKGYKRDLKEDMEWNVSFREMMDPFLYEISLCNSWIALWYMWTYPITQ